MTILITGGAGFIGSALIRHLIKHTNFKVVNIDKLTYAGNLESIKEISHSPRYFFECVDICNDTKLREIFKFYNPRYIMHLAAESHVDRSINNPDEFITTNIVGTYKLLNEAHSYWNNLKGELKSDFKFHHISTDEVFGDLPHPNSLLYDKDKPQMFRENSSYKPNSPYSASKASSDHLVRAWNKTYGLPVVITNCSNNYGPYHFPEKLIPLTILNALEGKKIPVYGDGNQIRDWLYVEDHAKALVKVVQDGKPGETFNIGGCNEKRNIEVVKKICSILDRLVPKSSKYSEQITYVKDRPGHDMRYAIDAKKIEKHLGWKPEETFESGIEKTVNWYINNIEWCKRVRDGRYKVEG